MSGAGPALNRRHVGLFAGNGPKKPHGTMVDSPPQTSESDEVRVGSGFQVGISYMRGYHMSFAGPG